MQGNRAGLLVVSALLSSCGSHVVVTADGARRPWADTWSFRCHRVVFRHRGASTRGRHGPLPHALALTEDLLLDRGRLACLQADDVVQVSITSNRQIASARRDRSPAPTTRARPPSRVNRCPMSSARSHAISRAAARVRATAPAARRGASRRDGTDEHHRCPPALWR